MKTLSSHIDIDLIERMRIVFDDIVLISLLEDFVKSLQSVQADLDSIPLEDTESVRFMSVRLRGTACEYGANRLVEIARTMEQSLKQGAPNAMDWRLLLRAEIAGAVTNYRDLIARIRGLPATESRPKLVASI